MNKKMIAILIEVVRGTPYTDHKTAAFESACDVIAKYEGLAWTKRREANFKAKCFASPSYY